MSINQPARVIGLFVSGYLSEKVGRKRCLILGSIVQIISAVAVYFCNSYESLMLTVALTGFSVCMITIPSYALLSEICLIRFRSSLASINTLHGNIGWLIGTVPEVDTFGLKSPFTRSLLGVSCSSKVLHHNSELPKCDVPDGLLEDARISSLVDEVRQRLGGQDDTAVASRSELQH